jgi:hypothetical protein
MPIAWRRDLATWLHQFVAAHPGLRVGRMFGFPAAYAGRRLVCCVREDGLVARLPPAAFEAARRAGAAQWAPKGRRMTGWVMFRPTMPREADLMGPCLEMGARYVAEVDQMSVWTSPALRRRPAQRATGGRRPAKVAQPREPR